MNNYVGHQRDKYEVKTSQCRPPILSGYRVLVRNSGFGRPCAGQTNVRHKPPLKKISQRLDLGILQIIYYAVFFYRVLFEAMLAVYGDAQYKKKGPFVCSRLVIASPN